ncbi:autophagy-related protein 13-domain-containing protein [Crucibulum laeve]|uniref:Autophagy-related protein 13 n=1 Tax=Crucibulum laeve TaxID=68775 RepID=A0A5C3LZN6_9AGAR|nr:autophagy-related protein 13-domain-containing protein [Crucibulum laeve]
MSNNDIQRADQIAFHFYTKLFYVVNEARATAEMRGAAKTDKWFNLETPDSDLFTREEKEPFKSISLCPHPGPPALEIQVLLTVPELTHNQVLVYLAPDSSRVRIEPTPRFVLLESWVLSFVPHDQDVDVALPTIYKHGIPLFRSLFSLLRVLPAWKLYKRLKRRTGGVVRNGHLGIQLRVRSSFDSDTDNSILRFHTPPSPSIHDPLPVQTQSFPGVPHPLGSLSLSATYLSTANFQLDELESLLSSRFISLDLDGGDGFVPTLTKNAQRDSLTGSSLPASSGIRSTLARSPPKPIPRPGGSDSLSVAERFILPSRTASLGSGSSGSRIPPPSRPSTSNSNFTQPAQLGSMTAANPLSGLAVSRLRRESLNSSPSSSLHRDLPSAPFPMNTNPGTSSLSSSPSSGPLPIRRPNINPVHPFKSNTLSSASGSSPSLSIRQAPFASGSPLSNPAGGVPSSSLARQHQPSGSTSSNTSRIPLSPVGGGFPFASSRPSPPTFAPSSLGDRRPGTSGSGGSGERDRRVSMTDGGGGGGGTEEGSRAMPSRKRYSSSFGHRYVGSVGSTGSGAGVVIAGAGSTGSGEVAAGSAGSGGGGLVERRERKESAVNSFLSTNTDDDDISHFVQDIDSRKPLSGRDKERQKRDRQQEGRSESSDSRSDSRGEESNRGQRHDRDTTDTTIRAKGKEREVPLRAGTVFPSGATTTTSSPVALAGSPSPLAQQRTSSLSSATALVNPPITTRQLSTSPTAAQMSTSPNRGPMLTNQGEVEERLRKMNEAFLKSLEGISGGAGGSVRRKERERERTRVQRGENAGAGSGEDVHSRRGSEGGGLPSRGDSSPVGEGNLRGSPSPFAPEMRLRLGDRRQGSTSSLGNSAGASQGSQEVVGRMDFDDDSRRQSRY